MSEPVPVLHLIAGPNGAGKSTLFEKVLEPVTHLEFINADRIAAESWPGDELTHAYDASRRATRRREAAIARRRSFATETVFSHPSKVELVRLAQATGYLVTLHVVMVPEELAARRVANRVDHGGHDVPEVKIRERWNRLWPLVVEAIEITDEAVLYDNSRASRPFRLVARSDHGALAESNVWPPWTPAPLREAANEG